MGLVSESGLYNWHLEPQRRTALVFQMKASRKDMFVKFCSLINRRMKSFTTAAADRKLAFIYLEVSKFKKAEDEIETHFDKWIYVLKNLHLLQEIPAKLQERIFIRIFEQAEIAKLTQEETVAAR